LGAAQGLDEAGEVEDFDVGGNSRASCDASRRLRRSRYDIIFHGPRFDASGKLLRPAHITAFHNGVLVQDNVELTGPTGHKQRPPYTAGPNKLPLALQDHSHPVRYRNIWLRELK
jgi:hypothetical protein